MLKALFLDMDETLCDTALANRCAAKLFADEVDSLYGASVNGQEIVKKYIRGIYREWTDAEHNRYLPIIQQQSEGVFRIQLIRDLLKHYGIEKVDENIAKSLQNLFDRERLAAFNFYPEMLEFLTAARKHFTLVVITNGPAFSQVPKVEAINLSQYVDHIIIGGQEPEQKPAVSIFEKALNLAGCKNDEAIHIGDSLTSDIAGANNSNIKSVWVSHGQTLDAGLDIKPSYIIKTPSDLPELIHKLQPFL